MVREAHLLRQFRIHSQTIVVRKPGAAGVSPPWFGRRACKNASAKLRETADGVLTNAGAIPFVKPRELTPSPLLLLGTRVCTAQKSLFVSQALVAHKERRASVRRDCEMKRFSNGIRLHDGRTFWCERERRA